jgi:hypothetical protein
MTEDLDGEIREPGEIEALWLEEADRRIRRSTQIPFGRFRVPT